MVKDITKTPAKRARKTPQDTAAQAVSTSLANVSRVVGVIFQTDTNNTVYNYHTHDDSIALGDYCIVISPSTRVAVGFYNTELEGSPAVVRVIDVKETVHAVTMASKFIVQKLDMNAVIEAAERKRQIEVLKAKISRARKEAEERIQLEQLRELSPELDSLITQLDTLTA